MTNNKSYYIEKPADVAERIRLMLKYVEPTQLQILPDCGFSQTARWEPFAKMQAMVAGTKIVRREVGGEIEQMATLRHPRQRQSG